MGSAAWVLLTIFRRLRALDRSALAQAHGEGLARARAAAALEVPGALPGAPIVVASAAVIETRATSGPCPYCGGHRHVSEHVTTGPDGESASDRGGRRLRRVSLRCGTCGKTGDLYFRIDSPEPD